MFATLQAALGTWPSDSSHGTNGAGSSGLTERIEFGGDDDPPPQPTTSSIFVLRPENFPSGNVFIPPYFVPPGRPGPSQHENVPERLQETLNHNATSATLPASGLPFLQPPQPANLNIPGLKPLAPKPYTPPPHPPSFHTHSPPSGPARSPSPHPNTPTLQRERSANWSNSAHQRFHAMLAAPTYVNRYRLSAEKHARLLAYLREPEVEPRTEEGGKDHQIRYQGAKWVLREGKLYRKVEGKGMRLRRHLDAEEVWDVLTAEHLRSGHLGRDRLRKVLERRFIGYTLQEIMFILRECKRCNGKEKAASSTSTDTRSATDEGAMESSRNPDVPVSEERNSNDITAEGEQKGPYERKQHSNFMWF